MPTPKPRTAPHCDLGVTGKRLRRALPKVSAPPAFREALRRSLIEATRTPPQDRPR